jgi:hypothetical protein
MRTNLLLILILGYLGIYGFLEFLHIAVRTARWGLHATFSGACMLLCIAAIITAIFKLSKR